MIKDIEKFSKISGQKTDEMNPRKSALYTGLQLEEMAEKIRAIGMVHAAKWIDALSSECKNGTLDNAFEGLSREKRAELLDADIDLAWVSIGAAISLGADVEGAFNNVVASNMSKTEQCIECILCTDDVCIACGGTGLVMHKDENGKVIKGKNYFKPDLEKFLL